MSVYQSTQVVNRKSIPWQPMHLLATNPFPGKHTSPSDKSFPWQPIHLLVTNPFPGNHTCTSNRSIIAIWSLATRLSPSSHVPNRSNGLLEAMFYTYWGWVGVISCLYVRTYVCMYAVTFSSLASFNYLCAYVCVQGVIVSEDLKTGEANSQRLL